MGTSPKDVSVGFIGLGIMGEAMAGHLQAAGHPLHVSTRTRAKAERLLAKGATWHDGPGKLAAACDVVITMVGYPSDVEAVYLGDDGLVPHAKAGAVLIDMTTSSPSLAVRIAAEGAKRGVAVLDAPVSGGDVGAREARLSIMVGGDAAAFERVGLPEGLTGIDLLDPQATAARKMIFGECFTHNAINLDVPQENLRWRWAIQGKWKLIIPNPSIEKEGVLELYDLDADPTEERNLATSNLQLVEDLGEEIDKWWPECSQSR
jgi:hypothetical protein